MRTFWTFLLGVIVGIVDISAVARMLLIAARRVYILNKKLLYRCCRNAQVNNKRTTPHTHTQWLDSSRALWCVCVCVRLFTIFVRSPGLLSQFYSAMCRPETGCSPLKCLMGFSPTNWPHAFIALICLYNNKWLCLLGICCCFCCNYCGSSYIGSCHHHLCSACPL